MLLGSVVACDGFHSASAVRVQTHVHDDHMGEFTTSKGNQQVVCSNATRALLIDEFDADLPYRSNLVGVDPPDTVEVSGAPIQLISNGHMLGAVQVGVEENGVRLGYSGDFQWPMEQPLQVDALVVDSTYGSEASIREYEQGEVEARLLELVQVLLKRGPVMIHAHRGTLQRALQVLSGQIACPMCGSEKLSAELEIYREHGYVLDALEDPSAVDGRYIHFYGRGDAKPIDPPGASIVLSAYMSDPRDPVLERSPRSYRVALSNHADFLGTLEYVAATGAQYVVTDNARGRGVELARALSERLGIEARPSSSEIHYEWGER